MTPTTHTAEPWRFVTEAIALTNGNPEDGPIYVHRILGADFELIATLDEVDGLGELDARRIVASVNALAGVPTEHIETWKGKRVLVNEADTRALVEAARAVALNLIDEDDAVLRDSLFAALEPFGEAVQR